MEPPDLDDQRASRALLMRELSKTRRLKGSSTDKSDSLVNHFTGYKATQPSEEEAFGSVSGAAEAVRSGFISDELDVRERLLIRGADRFASLVMAHGGWMDSEELAKKLGINTDTALQKVCSGDFLCISVGTRFQIPAFQFAPGDSEIWPQITALMKANLDSTHEGLILFLLSRIASGQTDATPLSMILDNGIVAHRLLHLYTTRFDHGS